MGRPVLGALLVTLALAGPAPPARAQSNPFAPLPGGAPQATTPTVTQATTGSSDTSGGLTTLQQVVIFGAAAVLLGGIAWVIVRDARRAAPVNDRSERDSTATGARHDRARARARAKAARRQRKRNR